MTIRTTSKGTTKISRGQPIVASKKPSSGKKKDKGKGKTKKPDKVENIIRGKEVTIREAASPGQVIYGKTKVGGVVTFITTSQESRAYLVTGDQASNNMAVWTAVATGAPGNAITLELKIINNNPSVIVAVVGNAITVTLKSTLLVATSTLNEVMTAVQASGPASALITVQKSYANTNGIVQALAITALQYGGGTWLQQFITLACHEITQITKVWCDGVEVTFGSSPDLRWGSGLWAGKIFMAVQYGTDTQPAQGDLIGQCPGVWRSTDRQQGCAGVTVIHVYDPTTYPEGYPELSFEIRGKPVYDPRSGLTTYSENAALILADMIGNTKYGLGSTLPCPTLGIAADICDTSVTINSGTEAKYRICGSFDTSDGAEKIIAEMEAAMAGKSYERDGDLVIHPGHYPGVLIASFSENDLAGPVEVNTHWGKDDSFNGARGTFVDPTQDYNEVDIAPVVNATYLSEDGGIRKWQDFTLNFVPSQTQGQRILKIRLEEIRQGISVSLKLKLNGLQAYIGSRFALSLAEFGWVSKMFEVLDSEIVVEGETVTTVEIEAIEIAAGIWNWSNGEETTVDLAANTNLPSASNVPDPVGVTLTSGTSELDKRQDGTIFSRLKVSWTQSTSEFVNFNGGAKIRYKKTIDSAWQTIPPLAGGTNFYRILDVQDGVAYDVAVKHFNVLGVESNWVQPAAHIVIGKSEKPLDVTGFQAAITNLGIIMNWGRSLEIDLAGYRIKRGLTNDWASGIEIEKLTTSTQFQDNFRTVGSYYYMIKAVDNSGNESVTQAVYLVTINAPNAIAALDIKVTNNVVLVDWDVPLSTSFPIAKYRLYKGMTFGGATLLGEAFVTFQAWTEQFAGSNYYWVTAVDTGGNESAPLGKFITWYNPPNTIQYVYNTIDPAAADLSSAVLDSNTSFLAPVRVEDSWSQHFTRNSWATIAAKAAAVPTPFLSAPSGFGWIDPFTTYGWASIAAKVAAGYTIWIEPADTLPGLFTRTIDTGVIIAGARIEVAFSQTTIHGSVTITTLIETSLDLATWTAYPIGLQALASNFRWVRVSIRITGANDKSLVRVISPMVSVGVRKYTLSGRAITSAAGAATIPIGTDFLSVNSIQISPSGGSGRDVYPVFNYSTLNPTSFDVLGYIAGAPGAVDFVWTVEGATGGI